MKLKKPSSLDILVDRNLQGIKLEKLRQVDEAIKLYELIILEDFDGNHPYTRLTIIYRRRKQINNEIRVLKKAVSLYKGQYKKGINCQEDLQKFTKRLEKAKRMRNKHEYT